MQVEDVRKRLREACEAAGGQSAFARAVGVNQSFVANVLAGRKRPSDKLCEALGLHRDGERWSESE